MNHDNYSVRYKYTRVAILTFIVKYYNKGFLKKDQRFANIKNIPEN